jgi:hypothetical protein
MKKVLGAMSKFIFALFSLLVLGLLMSLTYGALKILFPNNFANQMWGLVMFDIAAMCWALAFVFQSNSVGQYASAALGFIVAFLGTLLMVAAEVILDGQTFVENSSIGQWMVYGFIIVTAIHAALVYIHHAMAPDISEAINIGVARGEITSEAIRQATQVLDTQKAELAHSIHQDIVDNVKRDLNIPVAVDPAVGFVPAVSVPYPVEPKLKNKSWFAKFKDTLTPAQKKAAMKQNEQTVDQAELETKQEDSKQSDAPFQD